ncbi:MAG: sulfurtransferase, partial [Brachybacterium sp.]
RLVWMLRALGHDAAVLSGGLDAWDGPLETTDVRPAAGDVPVRDWPASRIATADEVAAGAALVIDARAAERYRGEVEPIDPRAGHIPGAVNLPFAENLDPEGRFLSPHQLRRRFEAAGVREDRETVVYCGSGVTATHDLLALERAGFTRVRLFPGSWSQWSAEATRPVVVGPTPLAALTAAGCSHGSRRRSRGACAAAPSAAPRCRSRRRPGPAPRPRSAPSPRDRSGRDLL